MELYNNDGWTTLWLTKAHWIVCMTCDFLPEMFLVYWFGQDVCMCMCVFTLICMWSVLLTVRQHPQCNHRSWSEGTRHWREVLNAVLLIPKTPSAFMTRAHQDVVLLPGPRNLHGPPGGAAAHEVWICWALSGWMNKEMTSKPIWESDTVWEVRSTESGKKNRVWYSGIETAHPSQTYSHFLLHFFYLIGVWLCLENLSRGAASGSAVKG